MYLAKPTLAAIALAAFLVHMAPVAANGCGAAEAPCEVASGTYHILLPGNAGVKGIVMHLHGGGGTGKGVLKSGLARIAVKRGYAFIAPDGYHPNNKYVRDWSVRARNTSHERDDMVFLRDVLADARQRHSIEADRVLLSGFSRGGSMVWDIACHAPDMASAYAPVAGAYWDDLPTRCKAPVKLFHAHGWNDRTVPLEGRSFRDGSVVQGDVWASLFVLRKTNGCAKRQPESSSRDGDYWWRHWSDCDAGRIDLVLFQGGHGLPKGWPTLALDWFEARMAE